VTVSGTGLAHCFPGARNVVGLLELAGRGDVPVSCGPEEPAGVDPVFHAFPGDWRRVADGRYGVTSPTAVRVPVPAEVTEPSRKVDHPQLKTR
jgi:hypothetical protein